MSAEDEAGAGDRWEDEDGSRIPAQRPRAPVLGVSEASAVRESREICEALAFAEFVRVIGSLVAQLGRRAKVAAAMREKRVKALVMILVCWGLA